MEIFKRFDKSFLISNGLGSAVSSSSSLIETPVSESKLGGK